MCIRQRRLEKIDLWKIGSLAKCMRALIQLDSFPGLHRLQYASDPECKYRARGVGKLRN